MEREPGLQALFAPQAMAVIGASANPDAIGGRPIRYARTLGFAGPVYPINPNRTEVQGLPAYPHLAATPGEIDLAVVAVAAAQAPAAIAAAAARGARAAVVLSAGFSEVGAAGAALQAQLRSAAQAAGIRVLGPNCLGVYSGEAGLGATFASCFQEAAPPKGPVALVSQSGAYGSYLMLLAARRGVGVGRWATTGNEMDVTVADLIAHFAADPAVRVIGCVAEGVSDGPAFLRALERARTAGKPVVLMKMGRTAGGAEAAKSHTAALAVDDAVFDAVVRQAGAHRVRTTRALVDLLYALELAGPSPGPRLGVVTMSGGVGVLMSDAAADAGLHVPRLPQPISDALQAKNPLGAAANPVDVTGQAMKAPALLGDALRAVRGSGAVDAVTVFLMNWLEAGEASGPLRAEILSALEGTEPSVALVGSMSAELTAEFRSHGVLTFDDPDRAIDTLAALARIGAMLAAGPRPPPANGDMPLADGSEGDEAGAKALMARAGLSGPREHRLASAEEAGAAAREIGAPVALKIVSPDLPHKSDVGGVRLGLSGADAVRNAAVAMHAAIAVSRPSARLEGFLVSEMAGPGVEMIVSAHHDPVFGPVVMVGMGGVLVEVLGDVAFRYGAIDAQEARAMVGELAGARLLEGVRGAPPADLDALAEAISRLSRFGVANVGRIAGVEINPLLVRPEGEGCLMLDALVTPAGPPIGR